MREYTALTTFSCTIAAFTNFFRLHNIDIMPEEMFCILDGFNISYSSVKQGIEMPDLFSKVSDFGVRCLEMEYDDINLEEHEKQCGIAYVRTFELDYNKFYQTKENYDRTHFIIIGKVQLGRIEVLDTHFTCDSSYKISSYYGSMNVESFKKAFINAYYLELSEFHYDKERIFGYFIDALERFITGYKVGDKFYGIWGIYQYFVDVLSQTDYDLYKMSIEINYNIKICSILYILNYCISIISMYDNESEYISLLGQEKELWNRIAFLLLKTGIEGNSEKFKKIIQDDCLPNIERLKQLMYVYLESKH